jgi:hypothetical protein
MPKLGLVMVSSLAAYAFLLSASVVTPPITHHQKNMASDAPAPELPPGVTYNEPGCRAPGPPQPVPVNAPPNSTYFAAGNAIPEHWQGDPAGWMKIKFLEPDEVNRVCAGGAPICGQVFWACTRGDVLIMSNPCREKDAPQDKGYAGTLCHEKAHFMGWPATHGDYVPPQQRG